LYEPNMDCLCSQTFYYFDAYVMWLLLESIVVLCCEAKVSFTGVCRLSVNEI